MRDAGEHTAPPGQELKDPGWLDRVQGQDDDTHFIFAGGFAIPLHRALETVALLASTQVTTRDWFPYL